MTPPFSRTFGELLREHAAQLPDHPFLLTPESTLSYAQMDTRATLLAAALASAGVARGTRVALLAPNGDRWLQVFFACAMLGATVVPVSTWSTPREIELLLTDASPALMFAVANFGNRDFAAELRSLRDQPEQTACPEVWLLGDRSAHGWPSMRALLESAPAPGEAGDPLSLPPGTRASATDPLAILYTSGSSAHPKAVPVIQAHAIENGFNIGERQGYGASDKVFVPVPLFWSYGAINALPAILSHGATLVTQPQFEPEQALALIEAHTCTAIYTLPAITNALLSAPGFEPARTASLRTGLTIGAPQDVRRAALDLGASEICNIYGSTETYGNCAVTHHHWPLARREQCQGLPLPGVRARVRDANGVLLEAGEIGSLEVHGYLTPGYCGKSSEHNATVFTDDGWFVTGDLAMLNADGTVSYAGRSSEMIKRSGINVSPAEIEDVLQTLPGVGLAGVTGKSDADKGELIIAFVVLRPDTEISADALLAHCREKLSRYKWPDEFRFVEALPLTPTGKLLRKALRASVDEDARA